MNSTITLPRLVGTRAAAEQLVNEAVRGDRDSDAVLILARAVSSAGESFADQLVASLKERGYTRLKVVGAPALLVTYLGQSADRRTGVSVEVASTIDA
jgi:hypothetical protein